MSIPPYLGRTDVPKYYPVCLRVVDSWIANGVVPIIRVGGSKPVFKSSEINKYLDSLLTTAKPPATKRGRPTKAEARARRLLEEEQSAEIQA